ncbi:hypothetical protein LINPERHAP1_LOCUS29144, partial [Linum perenne]
NNTFSTLILLFSTNQFLFTFSLTHEQGGGLVAIGDFKEVRPCLRAFSKRFEKRGDGSDRTSILGKNFVTQVWNTLGKNG